jgi:hypothetical protein
LCTGCLATLGFHAYKSMTGNLRPLVAVHLLRISPLSLAQAPPLSNLEGAVNHRRAWPLGCFRHEQNLPEYINMIARSARSKTKLYLRSPRLIGSTVGSFLGTTLSQRADQAAGVRHAISPWWRPAGAPHQAKDVVRCYRRRSTMPPPLATIAVSRTHDGLTRDLPPFRSVVWSHPHYRSHPLPRVPKALGEEPKTLGEAFPECNTRGRASGEVVHGEKLMKYIKKI